MTLFTLFLIAGAVPVLIIMGVLEYLQSREDVKLTEGLVVVMVVPMLITGVVWIILILNYIPNNGDSTPTEVIDDTTVIEDSA